MQATIAELADVIMAAIGPRLHYSRSPFIGWFLADPAERILIDPLIGRVYRYHFGAGSTDNLPAPDTLAFRRAAESALRARPGVAVRRADIPADTYAALEGARYTAPTVHAGELLPGFGDWFGSPADVAAQERAAR